MPSIPVRSLSDHENRYLCHCLQMTESHLRHAVAQGHIQSLEDAMDLTGAGKACTACHYRIRQIVQQAREANPPGPRKSFPDRAA